MRDGRGKLQATMKAIWRSLDAIGKEAESHRRESLGLSQTTRNMDNLDAPTGNLQCQEDSSIGARDAIIGGFVMGIWISKFDLGKRLEDFPATLERIAMAAKWDEETNSSVATWSKKQIWC